MTVPGEYPLRVTVYDRDYERLGWINAPRSLDVTIRHNEPHTCTLVLDSDHRLASALATRGARVVVEYLGLDSPRRLISGIVAPTGERDGSVGTVTYSVRDDRSLYWELLGWPNPTGGIDDQGDEDAYYRSTGAAETVVKDLVTKNYGHTNLPIAVATDQARGDDVDITIRMHPLADRLLPAVDIAGVGLDAYQDGEGVTVDVYSPTTRTRTLTEASGIILSGRWSAQPPTVTRVVVGGPGEGTARRFVRVPATLPSATETAWGVSIEQWTDARDLDEASSTLLADMRARGQRALDEGAPQYTVSATLTETGIFRYGVAYDLGDIVPVQLDDAPVISDRIRSISFSLTPDDGLVITPQVGREGDFEHVTFRHLARIARGLRNQEVSR